MGLLTLTLPGLGEWIRQTREAQGLSQQELADRVGVDKSSVSNYEREQRGLTAEVFDKIARALGARAELIVLERLLAAHPQLKGSRTLQALERLVPQTSSPPAARSASRSLTKK